MRGLDGQARIFIGSSSEGRAAAETTASALEAAGMRPLLWSDFFKTRDLPLQELDRRMADADGAILVGSADDRLLSRGKEFDQMRDNVLLEYGLFAGHLGRHRCILLMPDHPRFRIPSDFLGVVGFEFYTHATLNAVAKKVPDRLQAAFAADGFKPPSLQERCRRLLLFSGWMRGEIAKIRLELSRESLKEQFGEKIEAILCFLKEDIDKLGLREDVTVLEELLRESLANFPRVPDWRKLEERLTRDLRYFLRDPYRYLPSETGRYDDWFKEFAFKGPIVFDYCPWCSPKGRSYGGCHYRWEFYQAVAWGNERRVPCGGVGWAAGAIDALVFLRQWLHGEFDSTISGLDSWRQRWVPDILDRLGAMEQTVHKQIFGHL